MAMAMGLDATPAEMRGGGSRSGARRWPTLFVVLAAGWGALFGYSAIILTEDAPLRAAASRQPEPQAVGFPPLERSVGVQTVALKAEPAAPAPPISSTAATPAQGAAPSAVPTPSRVERADYVGTWGPTESACGARSRRRGYIPATITPERAQAGRTICAFRDGRRNGNAWLMAAECSDRGRRWSSQVRLVVDGDRLTWTSGKGSSSYVRCNRRAG